MISQALIDAIPLGVLITDTSLRIVQFNRWLAERLGIPQEHLRNVALEEAFPELRSRGLLAAYEVVLQSGQPITLSARIHQFLFPIRPDQEGELEYMPQSVLIAFLDLQDDFRGTITIIQDVTARVITERELQREIAKLEALHEIDHAIATLELDSCLKILVARTRMLFNSENVGLLLLQGEELELAAFDGWETPPGPLRIPMDAGVTGWVAEHKESVAVADVRQDGRYIQVDPRILSEMAAPLVVHDQCIGVLNVESSQLNAFRRDDVELLESLATRAASAVHNARLHEESEYWRAYYRAVTDHAGDVIYTLDPHLRLTTANAAWDQFARENGALELLSPKVLGRPLLDSIQEPERQKWAQICERLLRGELSQHVEDVACHSPMDQRWINLRAAPLRDEKGTIIGLVFSSRDITRRVDSENQLRRANTKLTTLLRASQLMSAHLALQPLLASVANLLFEVFDADAVTISRHDEEEDCLRIAATSGVEHEVLGTKEMSHDEAMEIVRRHGRVGLLSSLFGEGNHVGAFLKGVHSQMFVGVFIRRKLAALLRVYRTRNKRQFSSEALSLLEGLAAQLSLALENAELYAEQQSLAITDSLTGLANRRRFEQELELALNQTLRHGFPTSLIMLDIDDFKRFNDSYGHPEGDKLLKLLSDVLRDNLRSGDIPVRYGGEEFAVVLPATLRKAAIRVAERLRRAAENTLKEAIPARTLPSINPRQPLSVVTISLGVAVAPEDATEKDGLIRAADNALYEAKISGKNRVVSYST